MRHDPYAKDLKTCVFDIETTGLFSGRDRIISASFCDPQTLDVKQLFCPDPSLEKNTVQDILDELAAYDAVITYNGYTFDLPFLKARAERHGLSFSPDLLWDIDVFKRLRRYWPAAQTMPSLRQASVEEALGLTDKRDDKIRGADCIALYARFLQLGDDADAQTILLHNADDVRQLARISGAVNFLPWHRIALDEGFAAWPGKILVRGTEIKNGSIRVNAVMAKGQLPAAFYEDGWRLDYDSATGRILLCIYPETGDGLGFADLQRLPVDAGALSALPGFDSGFLVLMRGEEPCPREINALSRQLLKTLL